MLLRARRAFAGVLGFLLAVLAIYTASFGTIEEFYHRGGVAGLSGLVVVMLFPLADGPLGRRAYGRWLAWLIDALVVAAVVGSILWFFSVSEELWTGLFVLGAADIAVAVAGLVAFIELSRRCMGLPLSLLALAALGYCVFGADLPWIFRHAGYTPAEVVRTIWYSLDGVFGLAAAVTVGLIFIYIVFGVLLEGCGGGAILLRLASSLTGRWRGGPAHGAVLSSALFGTVSGSAAANVVGTGVFTIPMIRKQGFTAPFAGAVEAAASTGGQLLPPVMGAAAFMMVELTGIPYLTICAAALLPALFYFGSLFCSVALEARRQGVEPSPEAERARLSWREWLQTVQFFAPLTVVIVVLLYGRSPAMAGFWAIVTAFVTTLLVRPEFRRQPYRFVPVLARGGEAGARIMVAVVVIGVLIGTMNLTGLGLRFSNLIVTLGGDSLLLSLVMTMVASLALGMGLPTLPAYLIVIVVIGPALEKLGVPALPGHLFVIYFAALSAITPPVAIAAYAAAPLAGARPLTTGLVAVRLALVGFMIPFVFVYNPSLTLAEGFSWGGLAWVVVRLCLAVWLVSTAFAGIGRGRGTLSASSRTLRLGLALAALWPSTTMEIVATSAALLLLATWSLLHRPVPA